MDAKDSRAKRNEARQDHINQLGNSLGFERKNLKFSLYQPTGKFFSICTKLFFKFFLKLQKRHSQRINPKAAPLCFGILFSPNGVEKMIGLWYNAVNLLEGELFDDAFK